MRTVAAIEGWGKALLIAVLCVSSVAVAPGCSEDRCKTPKFGQWVDQKGNLLEGPTIQCNLLQICEGRQGRSGSRRLLTDAIIVDRGSSSWNEAGCIFEAKRRDYVDENCKVEPSPEPICLDAGGPAGGPGPGPSGPTGGTIVTVGAGSGDYPFSADGVGGAGGFSAQPGDEGQGE